VILQVPPNIRTHALLTHAAAAAAGAVLAGVLVWTLSPGLRHERSRHRLDPLSAPPSAYPWTELPEPAFPVPPYARFLKDRTIVLDPGHGGRSDRPNWKRGPTGLQEAEVNLSVARCLREFLAAAGANVVMTRDADVYLHVDDRTDLSMRIAIANEARADLFLSIHHNAADSPDANYTSVFYHGDVEDHPASVDAARNIVSGLDDALRLEQRLGVALVSDFEIYPREGFRVLREARVPAVLSEASFHSNPVEEQRLRDLLYNRREAYGLFLGLARWAQAGLPSVSVAPQPASQRRGGELVLKLDDGLSSRGGLGSRSSNIRENTIEVRLGGSRLAHFYDAKKPELRVTLPPRAPRPGALYVDFANTFGQHVLHPWIELGTANE
jgi:N-acetylmuramoyl-L-alanine amidase